MTQKTFDLTHGVILKAHIPVGFDELVSWGIASKLKVDDHPKVASMDEATRKICQRRFCVAMATCDEITGLKDFVPCTSKDEEGVVSETFLQWLSTLHADVFVAWWAAIDTLNNIFNSAELLPGNLLTEEQLNDPLSKPDAKSKSKG